MEEGNE